MLKKTKREITIMQWQEQIEKHMKRTNDSVECFKKFHDTNDLIHIVEDCERLIEICNNTKRAIEFMDINNIK